MAVKEIFERNTVIVAQATELLNQLNDRSGQYLWHQLTAENGDFVAYVTADDPDAYPNGAEQDGYWYEFVGDGTS